MNNQILLLARLLLAALFIVAGFGKFTGIEGFAGMLGGNSAPIVFAYAVAAFELLGGLALAAGVCTRQLSYAFAAFCVAAAFIGHPGETTAILKNFALAGGFLALSVAGAGAYAVRRD